MVDVCRDLEGISGIQDGSMLHQRSAVTQHGFVTTICIPVASDLGVSMGPGC